VANPQVTAQAGSMAQIRSIQEEWFMMSDQTGSNSDFFYSRAELQKIESGTILTITPQIGDSNEITLEMAVEVSDSIPRGADSDLPIVTRRQTKNKVMIQNGGTVAVAGLTETRNRSVDQKVPILGDIPIIGHAFKNKDSKKATRDIAVFVTANIVPESSAQPNNQLIGSPGIGTTIGNPQQPAGEDFKTGLADALRAR